MVYEYCTGDACTLERFGQREGSGRVKGGSVESSKRTASLGSKKGKEKELRLPDNSEDINPKLSLHDTPVSGEKIVKPGRRYPSRPRTVDFDSKPRGYSDDRQSSAAKRKPRQEVRFEPDPIVKVEPKIPPTQISEKASHKSESQKSLKNLSFKPPPTIESRQGSSTRKQQKDKSSYQMSASKSTDRIYIDKWMTKNILSRLSDRDRIISSRDHSKSREPLPNLDKDYIRNDSIKRIQKITLSTNKSEASKDFSQKPHEPTKKQLEEKFSCLDHRRKVSKEASTARFGSARDSSKPHTQVFQDDCYKEKYITDMPIDQITGTRIAQLHDWIKDLGYLKYYTLDKDLPDECKTGSVFFKLINHLDRSDVLKGENCSSRTAVKVNFDKVFAHLRKFEKFNPRYVGGLYFLINGNKHVFWGLVDDIRHVYGNKISKKDRRFKKANDIKEEEAGDEFTYSLSENHTRSNSRRADRGLNQVGIESVNIVQPSGRDGYSFRQRSTERKKQPVPKAVEGYSAKHLPSHRVRIAEDNYISKKDTHNINVIRSKARYVDLENTTKPSLKKLRLDLNNLADLEGDCRAWFDQLKIRANNSTLMFENPLRNGFILCYLCSLVFHRKLRNVCKDPKSINECKNNIETALNILRSTASAIPYELLWQTDEIMKGNPAVIWPLIASIKFIKDSNSANVPEVNLNRGANLSSVNVKTLPYTNVQIAQLEQSLLAWMIDSGAFNHEMVMPACFEDAMDAVSQGYVLYRLVQRITGKNLRGLHQRPTCMANYTHNVRKVLELLLTVKNMSRKFLWKVEEVVNKERFVIIGLLEDLHRLSAGLPKRNDPDYFADGPLIVQPAQCLSRQRTDDQIIKREEKTPEKKMTGHPQNIGQTVIDHFRIRNRESQQDIDTTQLMKLINEKPHAKNPAALNERTSLSQEEHQIARKTSDGQPKFDAEDLPVSEDQLNKTIRLLLLMNMPRIVERESWQSSVWGLFSDG